MNKLIEITTAAILFLLVVLVSSVQPQTDFIWGKQFGTDKEEYAISHVIDQNGNSYIASNTTGAIDGQNFGKNDGIIIKVDSIGNTVWVKQFGSGEDEDVLCSTIDNNGCVYITGSTIGVLNDRNFGKEDIFVVKYNQDGHLEWTKQFGTDSTDKGNGIYADPKGFIYVTGITTGTLGQSSFGKTDGFIMKLDADGNKLFTYQFGTTGDDYSIAITGSGNSDVYVCGSTWGDFAGRNKGMIDAFAGKFTDKDKKIDFIQFGTDGFDISAQIILDDEKNIYVGGSTSGNFGCEQIGEGDCFLTKINTAGIIEWTSQFGTSKHDGVRGITFNNAISDNILISGLANLPPANAFIRMYKKDGSLLWERNFTAKGINGDTSGKDISMDNKGNIYHMGLTGANLFGTLIGGHDIYLVKLVLDKSCMKH